MSKKVGIIGSGFSSLASAAVLAKHGFDVHLYEKNPTFGGRARQFETNGFVFDMGPSWYWMPEVFENFFKHFGKSSKDYYDLVRLDPSYKVIFGKNDELDLPADYDQLKSLFEKIEAGSSIKLDNFLKEAEYKYRVGMDEFVWKPGQSLMEFAQWKVVKSFFKLDMLNSISSQIRAAFKNEKLRQILEFPVLFLGATPQNTPALYSLMNYADIKLGTWYPMGGMHKIIEAFMSIGNSQGVKYYNNSEVSSITNTVDGRPSLTINNKVEVFDYIVAGADYNHVDQSLLQKDQQNYTDKYWEKRTMAPSSILFYLGLDKKIDGFLHHNLFFDQDFNTHAEEIYTTHKWPLAPLFYVCVPSVTDHSIAPTGNENVFILIPISTELTEDTEAMRDKYFEMVVERIKELKGVDISKHVIYKKSFCISDFKKEYNAFKGNAYGLANTLKQTAVLKPKLKSDHIKNMYFTGQLTLPGPGMPPSIISGQMVADLIIKKHSQNG
jgi:phytoene desaturase